MAVENATKIKGSSITEPRSILSIADAISLSANANATKMMDIPNADQNCSIFIGVTLLSGSEESCMAYAIAGKISGTRSIARGFFMAATAVISLFNPKETTVNIAAIIIALQA